MSGHRQEIQKRWNEWSDDFQALWTAETAKDELPPAASPFEPNAPGGTQQDTQGIEIPLN